MLGGFFFGYVALGHLCLKKAVYALITHLAFSLGEGVLELLLVNAQDFGNPGHNRLGLVVSPVVSGEDGARAIEVMCAALKSMQTGAWVDLPLGEEIVPPFYEPPEKED